MKVVLYGKPGCHLCDDVEALLQGLSRHYPHTLEKIDVTANSALFARYGLTIPVLQVNGCDYPAPLDRASVERALAGSA